MPDDEREWERTPHPDPTVLTTAQLYREIGQLRDLLISEIHHRRELTGKQLAMVEQKFADLADRTLEQKQDTKAAVDAALQAAKEAVGQQTEASERSIAKSEAATTKQIDSVTALLTTSTAATGETISDLKSRMDRMEAAQLTNVQANANRREDRSAGFQGYGILIAAISALVAVGALVALVFKP
jgi:hypothetical protein